MNWSGTIFVALQIVVCVTSMLYGLLGAVYARKWRGQSLPVDWPDDELPALTLLRPIKSGVPALREKLREIAKAMRGRDRLVLGVNEGSPEAEACDALRADFSARDIVVVRCRDGMALNPKISKLMQMDAEAGGEHLLLSDSEAMIDAVWLDAFRREWAASGADAMTCGYRFTRTDSFPQILDAAPTLSSLWPGLFFLNRFGKIAFTLGACTALRRSHLARVGGWAAFAGDLAEDNRLGAALAQHGSVIRLSQQVATLDSDPMSWRDFWRHQRRIAVTYRVCDPVGFAGMILTHSVWVGIRQIVVPTANYDVAGILLVGCICTQLWRWSFLSDLAKTVGFSHARLFPTILLSDLVGTLCWLLAWTSPRVWWAGKWWRISRDGKLRGA